MSARISVVVPTYHRPDLLDHCLQALLDQDLDPKEYEVVVVDDAADHATRRQVECWAERASHTGRTVRYISTPGRSGPAAARNAGARAACASFIAFTDDDCVPQSGWLSAGLAALTDGADIVSGQIVVPIPGSPTDYERNASLLANAYGVTANCFCRRDVLEAVGGFDERFTSAWLEDSDLFFTLEERGYRIVDAPEAMIVHPVRPGRWGESIRQQRKARFNALLYSKHPALYWKHIQPNPPWRYYVITALMIAGISGWLRGRNQWTVTCVGLWATFTGRFCLERLTGTSHAPEHVAEMIVTSIVIPPLAIFWRLWGAVRYRVLFL